MKPLQYLDSYMLSTEKSRGSLWSFYVCARNQRILVCKDNKKKAFCYISVNGAGIRRREAWQNLKIYSYTKIRLALRLTMVMQAAPLILLPFDPAIFGTITKCTYHCTAPIFIRNVTEVRKNPLFESPSITSSRNFWASWFDSICKYLRYFSTIPAIRLDRSSAWRTYRSFINR